MKATTYRIALLSFLIAIILVLSSASSYQLFSAAGAAVTATPKTPIKHIVIIIQENHAFDNMFGAFPGIPAAYALNLSVCMPVNPPAKTPCIKPWNADSKESMVQNTDLPHTRSSSERSYAKGKMDGFILNDPSSCENCTMAYYTGSVLPYYWDYASYYAMNYDFMSSALSDSLPNHLFAVAASAGSEADCLSTCHAEFNLTFAQIAQSLTTAGISWGYYQYNWNDKIDCPKTNYTLSYVESNTHGGWDGLWSGLSDFVQVQKTPVECSSLKNEIDLENAISSNTLPAVSWVIPEPTVSDHPGQSSLIDGQKYVSSVINMIEQSKAWSSTAIFLTYDEAGGYYDGITPLQLDPAGDGFRVPLIVISPYSIPGGLLQAPAYNYGSGFKGIHQVDFSSFLSTIEYNWGLKNLTDRDGYEPNLFYMLNFSQKPLPPLILASSGVTYPISSCPPSACSYSPDSTYVQSSIFQPGPNVGINESIAQALNYSGNGDPAD